MRAVIEVRNCLDADTPNEECPYFEQSNDKAHEHCVFRGKTRHVSAGNIFYVRVPRNCPLKRGGDKDGE